MLEGIGDLGIITRNLPANKLFELNLLNFTYESASEVKKSQKMVKGKLRDQSSAQGTITDTLTFRINDIDFGQMQFAMGKLTKSITSFTLPVMKYGDVPESPGPYQHDDAGITVANLPDIFVYFNSDAPGSPPQPLTPTADATTAPAASGEVQIDTTGNMFVFHSDDAGRSFSYTIPSNIATAEALGGPGTSTQLGSFKFFGKVYGTKPTAGYDVMFPEVTIDGRPTIDFSQDVPALEITATPATPSDWDEPFIWINSDTIVLT